jgi:putative zinc finger/helix-turn-helix YgiT family protein
MNVMFCDQCQSEMKERKATVDNPYLDDLCGLSNVYLAGITVQYCPRCGAESPIIPRVEELHREIARVLTHKPTLLTGEEVRFLRKQAGFPARKFAALLGVSPEHLSRVENGHSATLSRSADRLARAVATAANDGVSAHDILLKIADELKKKASQKRAKTLFRIDRNRWKAAA